MTDATLNMEPKYYVPHTAKWPLIGSVGLTLLLGGFAAYLNGAAVGANLMWAGLAVPKIGATATSTWAGGRCRSSTP